MANHGKWDRRREGRGIVRRQAGSGLSIRQFCREHQLAESAFCFRRRELARREREQRPSAPAAVVGEFLSRADGWAHVPVKRHSSSGDLGSAAVPAHCALVCTRRFPAVPPVAIRMGCRRRMRRPRLRRRTRSPPGRG